MKKLNLKFFREKYELITLILALIGFISVLLPSFSFVESDTLISVWNWGFTFMFGDKGTGFGAVEQEIMIPGIITNIILLVGASIY